MKRKLRDFAWMIKSRFYKNVLICFGTSLTEGSGWVKMLQKEMPDWYVVNFGKGGECSDWGTKVYKKILYFKPKIVLMEWAINDAYIRYPKPLTLAESKSNLIEMIYFFKSKGIEVYVQVMNPPLDIFLAGRNPLKDRPEFQKFYELHREISKNYAVPFIDHVKEWNKLSKRKFLEYCPDGLHPNELGSQKITIPLIKNKMSIAKNLATKD